MRAAIALRTALRSWRRGSRAGDERGQALLLLVLAMATMLVMAALLFDAAQAVVVRRRLQSAADAAATAGANLIQSGSPTGCSANGSVPASAKSSVDTAARASITANTAGMNVTAITVTCPATEPDPNEKVQVTLTARVPTLFLGAVSRFVNGGMRFDVTATATARYARSAVGKYSIIALEQVACQGASFSGGPSITLGGSFQVNSPCTGPQSSNSALYNGGNPSVTLLNGSIIRIVGKAYGAAGLSPAPLEGQPVVSDPLIGLAALTKSSYTTRSSSKLTCKNMTCGPGGNGILLPGRYIGGINLSGQAVVFMKPGIYLIEGGGIDVGTGTLCTIDQTPTVTLTATTCAPASSGELLSVTRARWRQACATTCGVLLYNTQKDPSPAISMGDIQMQGGANFMAKPFIPTTATEEPYKNIVIWQDRTASPQAAIRLRGGGALEIVGTVYSPLGTVDIGGNASANGPAQLTMQVISNLISVSGNSSFEFIFDKTKFAEFYTYGLVE